MKVRLAFKKVEFRLLQFGFGFSRLEVQEVGLSLSGH